MIDVEGVEVVLDGSVVVEGGKLIRLDVGTTGPVYKLELGVETYNAMLWYRAWSYRSKTRLGGCQ